MKNTNINLTLEEFTLFQNLIHKDIGIYINPKSKDILKNKFTRKLRQLNLSSFEEYYDVILKDMNARIDMYNTVTTNETYFFREHKQFLFLQEQILPNLKNKKIDVWSAASSSGAEAYTLSMILNNTNMDYQILGSDINSDVIHHAKKASYPLKWLDKIPSNLQMKYCDVYDDELIYDFYISDEIKQNVKFEVRNLIHYHSDIGAFDIVFLRNVLIYFDEKMKKQILKNILKNLKVGGYLFISVTEHIHKLDIKNLKQIDSSIFQKVA